MLTTDGPSSGDFKYKAFLSYSHANTDWGEWLHKSLETYRVPSSYVGMSNKTGRRIERKLGKFFRDRDELNSGSDLNATIREALEASENLIVICSPRAARSTYVNQEIIEFKKLGRSDHIHALIVDGEPHAEKSLMGADEECLPAALQFTVDQSGKLTGNPAAEIMAPDARPGRDGKRRARLKLIAGLLGVEYDLLFQRDRRRRRQQQAAMAVLVAIAFLLVGIAIQKGLEARRDQRITRHEAYATALNQAEESYRAGDHTRAVQLLQQQKPLPGAEDLREFAWGYLWRLYDNHRRVILTPGEATSMVISPDSKSIAITNDTQTVTVWDLFNGKQLLKIEDPEDKLSFARFTDEGRALVTAGKQAKIRVWDAASSRLEKTQPDRVSIWASTPDARTLLIRGGELGLELLNNPRTGQRRSLEDLVGHGEVTSSSFSPDGRTLALGYEHAVVLFDVSTAAKTFYLDFKNNVPIKSVRDVHFAPDGSLLAIGIIGSEAHEIVLWDLPARKERLRLRGPDTSRGEIVGIHFTTDGGKIALLSGSPNIVSPRQHSELVVWDTKSGRRLFVLSEEETGFITALQFAPDGKTLATGSRDHAVRFWDSSTGGLRNVIGIHHETMTREGEEQNVHRDRNLLYSRHDNKDAGISRLLFSPDGKTLATSSAVYATVRTWNTQTEAEHFPIQQRADHYASIAFSPDRKTVAVGDWQGTVALWDSQRQARSSEVTGAHLGPVYAVAFSPPGDRLVSVSADRVLKLWRTATMEQEAAFAGPPARSQGLSFGTLFFNDKILVNIVHEESPPGATPQRFDAKVWDVRGRRNPIEVSAPLVALAADGSKLASVDCKAVVWNLATWSSETVFDRVCTSADYQRASLSADGQYLAVGGPGVGRDRQTNKDIGGIRLFRMAGPKTETLLPLALGYSSDDALRSLVFSPDGRLLATVSSKSGRAIVTLWDIASHTPKFTFVPAPAGRICEGYPGASCTRIGGFSPDSNTIALISGPRMPQAGPNELTLWHLDTDRKESFISNHRVDELMFSPDNKTFATLIESRGHGEPAVLRERETGHEIATLGNYQPWINSVRQAADGRVLAVTYEYPASKEMVAKVWDVGKGEVLASQADWATDAAGPVAIGPNGGSLAASAGPGVVIWSLDHRARLATLNGQMPSQDRPTGYGLMPTPSMPFSPDGRLLATARSGEVVVFDTSTGRELRSFKGTTPIAFSPQRSRTLATTNNCSSVTLWDLDTGRGIGTLPDNQQCLSGLAFSPDEKVIVTVTPASSFDRTPAEITLWDVDTRRVRVKLKGGESDYVGPPAFTPDGKTLATAGKDGSLDLWDSLTGRRLFSLQGGREKITGLEFSRDGKVLVVGYSTSVGIYSASAKQP